MTVDEVINGVFRDAGYTEEEIETFQRGADAMDPMIAAAGNQQVTPDEAAAIRRDLIELAQLPKETVLNMLKSYQARAKAESVVN